MEIILKNTTNEFQKCTLFGNYDRAFKHKRDKNDFFDFTTGKGVEIYFDGDLSELKRLYFLKSLHKDRFDYSRLEYTDSDNKLNSMFHLCLTDANGKSIVKEIIPVIPQNHVKITDETIFPVKISGDDLKCISVHTCFLFLLRPKQQIILNFVESE